jgi:hypothetical protein
MMALPSSTEKPISPADTRSRSLSIVNSERWGRPELVRALQHYFPAHRRSPRRQRFVQRNSLTTRSHPSQFNGPRSVECRAPSLKSRHYNTGRFVPKGVCS